jgi:AcrR family transcriptional regulator
MVRQARSEMTRRKIVNAAVDLFVDVGYGGTGLGDIIDRVGLTKGAIYYHFDSKQALARAVVADGISTATESFIEISSTPAPALENMIHGTFVVADLTLTNKLAGTAIRLARTLGEFNDVAAQAYRSWMRALSGMAAKAQEEGDVRVDLDPTAIGELALASTLGVELLSNAITESEDLIRRLGQTWQVLLPAIATPDALPYFQQYLERETIRHAGSVTRI